MQLLWLLCQAKKNGKRWTLASLSFLLNAIEQQEGQGKEGWLVLRKMGQAAGGREGVKGVVDLATSRKPAMKLS